MWSKKSNASISDQTAYASKGQGKGQRGSKGKGQSKSGGKSSKGAAKGKGGDRFGYKPGDWTCPSASCGANVFASKDKCFKCGTAKPGGGGSGGKGGGGQSDKKSGKKGGGKGGGKKFTSGGKGGQKGGGGTEFKDWTCSKCKMVVFGRAKAVFCPSCGEKKA